MCLDNFLSDSIFKAIEKQPTTTKAGLLDGLAGESLYYFYRSALLNDDEVLYEKGIEKLQTAIEIGSKNSADTSFYSGVAGIGWLVLHLKEQEFVDIDIDDFLDTSVDTYLYETMLDFLNRSIYDFFYGAAGICYYFLKRYQCVRDNSQKELYRTYIMHFLFYLEFIKNKDEKGIFWKHPEYPFEEDSMCFQLSSLSNISSIILLLTDISYNKEFTSFCTILIKKSSDWLIYKLETYKKIRLDQAFCLWKASIVLNDNELQKKALQLLNTAKKSILNEDVISLAKCALIYQKITKETDNNSLKEEAFKCFTKVTDNLLEHTINDNSIWKGYSGIGLIDFSLNDSVSPEWSKCILI
ncbi:lanthionine synthetase LanC family protein [Kordia algicida OT-1]|uniref:Lanthionine synthetase C-like protein n=1 Tax=Kordia algicida OT-1 TaxID=391587 RepID=A9DQD0_9FLAO|nr:lanthionine synthetase LanC family protein [Kordia algicida]EDP96626.1 hypothetical protein KAOT1_15723 [Kordia algicida OT-1]